MMPLKHLLLLACCCSLGMHQALGQDPLYEPVAIRETQYFESQQELKANQENIYLQLHNLSIYSRNDTTYLCYHYREYLFHFYTIEVENIVSARLEQPGSLGSFLVFETEHYDSRNGMWGQWFENNAMLYVMDLNKMTLVADAILSFSYSTTTFDYDRDPYDTTLTRAQWDTLLSKRTESTTSCRFTYEYSFTAQGLLFKLKDGIPNEFECYTNISEDLYAWTGTYFIKQ